MKIPLELAREFNKINFPAVKACAGCVLTKGDKILLTKRSANITEGNKWCIPGGHIDMGEDPEEAVKREIKEETGLEIKNLEFLFYADEYIPEIKVHNLPLIFKGLPVGDIKMDKEVSEFGWFTKVEALKLNFAFKHKNIVIKFFNMEK